MQKRQQQQYDAYARAKGFLDRYPGAFGAAQQQLGELIVRLRGLGMTQQEGRRLGRNETARQREQVRELREQHLRPIARIAKAALRGVDGIAVALELPSHRLGTTRLVADARAVHHAATPYAATFVAHSLPENFLEQLDATISTLEQSVAGRADSNRRKVGAVKGLGEELRRGRDVMEILDAVVRKRFARDAETLARWESTKRVRGVPGGRASAPGGITPEQGGLEAA